MARDTTSPLTSANTYIMHHFHWIVVAPITVVLSRHQVQAQLLISCRFCYVVNVHVRPGTCTLENKILLGANTCTHIAKSIGYQLPLLLWVLQFLNFELIEPMLLLHCHYLMLTFLFHHHCSVFMLLLHHHRYHCSVFVPLLHHHCSMFMPLLLYWGTHRLHHVYIYNVHVLAGTKREHQVIIEHTPTYLCELVHQLSRERLAISQRHEAISALALDVMRFGDDSALWDKRVLDQRRLDFRRAQQVTRHVQHVVDTPGHPQVAIFISPCTCWYMYGVLSCTSVYQQSASIKSIQDCAAERCVTVHVLIDYMYRFFMFQKWQKVF